MTDPKLLNGSVSCYARFPLNKCCSFYSLNNPEKDIKKILSRTTVSNIDDNSW